ncbi:MAG: thioredoxin family protein [Crocinitomicaceae bacterium]|nr:thioredoxin family protein [Crocinitomicaceae bacterium]MDP4739311.1 thioredoxin family protein [Crocinitomicaceae bacterium]MDP4799173.1 thioredoxin family protein [Crocinitomicaceae bacterium]MDP4868425.1 thioredoxin family protein [Crocinitomicaceae bacterium]MDP4955458.1 thioredoxin family protein [Crocinitomicaceae bacterium]
MHSQELFTSELLAQAMDFTNYMQLSEQLVAEGRTSGPNQSAPYVYYTKLNLQRMKRLNKTVDVPAQITALLQQKTANWKWITITEPWCGDAAQCVPVIEKLAQAIGGIQSQYLLRDEHPEIMDAYLTNGGRSIPKLICLDAEGREVFTWGPRPDVIQEVMNRLKADGVTEISEIVEAIQKAYNDDKQNGIYQEFEVLLKALN